MRTFLLLAVLVSVSSAAAAQSSLSDLAPGTRLRITAPSAVERKLVGTLTAQNADSLTITREKAARQTSVAFADISSIDRSKGRSHGIGAVIGAAGGAIAGVLLGVVCVSVCPQKNNSGANLAPIGGFVIGLPAGAILGGLVGLERWERVRFRP